MSALQRKLQIERNGKLVKEIDLNAKPNISVGRDRSCDVFLEDPKISRKHAQLRLLEGKIELEKISEFSPLLVNGREVTGTIVKSGDVVEMGSFLIRVVEQQEALHEEPKRIEGTHLRLVSPSLKSEESEEKKEIASEKKSVPKEVAQGILPTHEIQSPAALESLTPDAVFEPNLAEPILASSPISPDQIQEAPMQSETPLDAPLDSPLDAPLGGFALEGEGAAANGEAGVEMDLAAPGDSVEQPPSQELEVESDSTPDQQQNQGEVMTGSMTAMLKVNAEARLFLRRGNASSENFVIRSGSIVAGRDQECDLILDEKKASRKQFKIYRNGNKFFIQDLGSSNGTYVNQKRITEAALSSEDRIRVGETEFQFVAQEESFEERAQDFLPVEREITEPIEGGTKVAAGPQSLTPDGNTVAGGLSALPPSGFQVSPDHLNHPSSHLAPAPALGSAPPAKKAGMIDTYIRNFDKLPWYKKILTVFVVAGIVYAGFEEDIDQMLGIAPKPVLRKKAIKKVANQGPKDPRSMLPKEKREFIERQYELAFDYYKKHDFDKTLYELEKIFQIFPDDERAKELDRYAREGKRKLELLEREKRIAEEAQKKAEKLQVAIADTGKLMASKRYDEAKIKFAEILALDPENAQVSVWQKEIDAYYEEIAAREHAKKVAQEIAMTIQSRFKAAQALQEAGKFHDAIAAYDKLLEDPLFKENDPALLERIKGLRKICVEEIAKLRDPLLADARASEKAKNLSEAYRLYDEATKVDPPHPEGYEGMDRIRDILESRSKALYAQASVAEGYTEFEKAIQIYKQIVQTAPKGSLYYERAQRKLNVYKMFEKNSGISVSSEEESEGDSSLESASSEEVKEDTEKNTEEVTREPASESTSTTPPPAEIIPENLSETKESESQE